MDAQLARRATESRRRDFMMRSYQPPEVSFERDFDADWEIVEARVCPERMPDVAEETVPTVTESSPDVAEDTVPTVVESVPEVACDVD